ncbi:hypothetical protein LUZ61_017418 [Rhynchospora tenuis]|uniref:F-box domain-containing protein n=1 Tax=Rhynchospora tenuis TaxID=198213 RepID=A0AAD5Z7C1_9POAL|nr:hypothetical protein LUZ61_017418 [Rhynchospora tenuis]
MVLSLWRWNCSSYVSDERDWSDLPPELLYLVSQKLTDIYDFMCFRAICKRWRSAVRASDLAHQLPWIIIYDHDDYNKGYRGFYSLLTGKTYTVNFPQSTENKVARGSAYNYLFIRNWGIGKSSLFNPFTNEELLLPGVELGGLVICMPSVQLLPASDQSSSYVCMTKQNSAYFSLLYSCQLGDPNWTSLQPTGAKFQKGGFALCDGMCYASDLETGGTKVINLATRTVDCVVPRPEPETSGVSVFLVVSSFGQILRVCRYLKHDNVIPFYFDIYRLELGNRDGNAMDPCWIKIDNIDNQFFFVHEDHGCAFKADDFPGFIGNSIYFLRGKAVKETQINRYDMIDGNIEVREVPINFGNSWFVPSLCKQSSNSRS